MTPAREIIATLAQHGVALRLDGPNIVHRGPRGAIGPALLSKLKANKSAIVAELQRQQLQRQEPAVRSARSVAPPCPSDIVERSAIIEEGAGCDRATADRKALAEFGFGSFDEFADAHRAHILAALNQLPAPASDDGQKLMRFTRRFVDTEHWRQAVALGSELHELYGVNKYAPLNRVDGWGVVTWLALSTLVVGCTLESITEDRATVRKRNWSVLVHYRWPPGQDVSVLGRRPIDVSVLWFECAEMIGGNCN
jgi:hypothetical protein